MHLKEKKTKTILEVEEKAENYVEAHATDIVFNIKPKPSNTRSLRPDTRQCHNCGEVYGISVPNRCRLGASGRHLIFTRRRRPHLGNNDKTNSFRLVPNNSVVPAIVLDTRRTSVPTRYPLGESDEMLTSSFHSNLDHQVELNNNQDPVRVLLV